MKRQSLLFIAGGLMALASCTSETSTTTNNEMSQASIDSAVNARVEEMRTQMMMENDSLINEMALYKADSMCAAMKGQAPKPRPKTAAKPSVPSGTRADGGTSTSGTTTTNNTGGVKSMSDQNQGSASDRMKGMSDQKQQSAKDKLKGMSDKK
jgi:hypothetical protein